MDMSDIINALRNRARNFVSLDTPQDGDLLDVGVDIGAGFVPGVGTALSARDFERARREDDKLGMVLSTAGMIPVVGGVPLAINKATKAATKAKKVMGTDYDEAMRGALRSEHSPSKQTWAGYATREEWEAKQARDQEQNKRIAEAWKRIMEKPMERTPPLTEEQIPRIVQTSGYNPRGWMGYPTQEAYQEAMKLKATKDAAQNVAIAEAWKKRTSGWPLRATEKDSSIEAFPMPEWKTRFQSIK